MPIRVLGAHMAELIAAGEVVERPSSVVKELAENALDAGAGRIEVEIERGGLSLIRVQDDGKGIPAEEIPLAFLRHATSKLETQADLEAISTLGFRGEALASIASVARVELLCRAGGEENASLYRIEGGEEKEHSEAARPAGATFLVRDLFYNTPARMKFLKKDASEAAYVTETVGRLALSHPEVVFRFLRDGRELFATPGDGKLESAVYAVLGREFATGLLPAQGGKPPYRVSGLVTPPAGCRGSRSMQYFYVNGRFVKNRGMMAALEQAFRGSSMQGKFPGCVLFLSLPPQLVDVNVHPAKTEVRFASESEVFSAVYAAVKEALAAGEATHGVLQLQTTAGRVDEPDAGSSPKSPLSNSKSPAGRGEFVPVAPMPPAENRPVAMGDEAAPRREAPPQNQVAQLEIYGETVQNLSSSGEFIPYETARTAPPPREWGLDILPQEEAGAEAKAPPRQAFLANEKPAETPAPQVPGEELKMHTAAEQEPGQAPEMQPQSEEMRYIGELFSTYILAQRGETLFVIDKHAAHERFLYEKLKAGRLNAGAQQLLTPVAVQLGAKEKEALLENEELLAESGLEVEDFGAGGVVVRALPADIGHTDIEALVTDVAKGLAAGNRRVRDEKTEWVLHSMACRAAVKGGDKTPPGQLLHLAGQIIDGAVPPFCPHGRPVVLEITRKELEKQFGRLG